MFLTDALRQHYCGSTRGGGLKMHGPLSKIYVVFLVDPYCKCIYLPLTMTTMHVMLSPPKPVARRGFPDKQAIITSLQTFDSDVASILGRKKLTHCAFVFEYEIQTAGDERE